MNAEATFRAKAPGIMAKLLSDFPIGVEDAAAILGNLGHECAGFTLLQETKPTAAGSRGGFGWAQWTGPRRRAYEAYCTRNKLNPRSDQANYAYLFIELKGIEGSEGSEKATIGKTMAAQSLDAKVEAFALAFLRAGVKHYDSRKQWARIALDAWKKAGQPSSLPTQPDIPTHPQPKPVPIPASGKPERQPSRLPGWLVPAALVVGIAVVLVVIIYFNPR